MSFANVLKIVLSVGALTAGSAAMAQVQVSGSNGRGSVTQSLALSGGTALLSTFDLSFGWGNDHHIKTVRFLPAEAQNEVSVAYADKNGDDAFSWRVGFHRVVDSAIITNSISGNCRASCSSTVSVPDGYTFVLRGFQSRFASEDHQIKTIGVEHGGNQLTVYMSDKNGDDMFDYVVRYALVPNRLIATSGRASGNGVGTAQAQIPAGRTVIKGFMLHYSSVDHHISRMAVQPSNGQLKVAYHDKNGDDAFAWRVQWANLR